MKRKGLFGLGLLGLATTVALSASLVFQSAPPAKSASAKVSLTGAGATFPYPLYSKWFFEYQKVADTQINYQSIGSGGGIKQITTGTVDFGASDAPMTDEELKAAPSKLLHIPTALGSVVVTYNLPGLNTDLKLTAEAVAGIFLGEIKKWNDPKIAAANPGVKLPNTPILVVHRSDGSGTTYVFTDYLTEVSSTWKQKVGTGKSVAWPVGLGAKGNEGVAGQVKQMEGAIGYVELAYAEQNDLSVSLIRNAAGKFVQPSIHATTAAAAGAINKMPADYRVSIVNPEGENAYPIASFTYILVYEQQTNRNKGEALVKFLWWAIHEGQSYHAALLYAPLPEVLVKKLEKTIKSIEFQGTPLIK